MTELFYTISPERLRRAFAGMTQEERQELLVMGITTCLEVLMLCQDQYVRMEARDVVVSLLPPELRPKQWSFNGWQRSDYMPGRWGDN